MERFFRGCPRMNPGFRSNRPWLLKQGECHRHQDGCLKLFNHLRKKAGEGSRPRAKGSTFASCRSLRIAGTSRGGYGRFLPVLKQDLWETIERGPGKQREVLERFARRRRASAEETIEQDGVQNDDD